MTNSLSILKDSKIMKNFLFEILGRNWNNDRFCPLSLTIRKEWEKNDGDKDEYIFHFGFLGRYRRTQYITSIILHFK